MAAPPVNTFSPTPILWTRVSSRRCYWNRCAFCVQNVKHRDLLAPEASDAARCVERLKLYRAHGHSLVIFGDEALSPTMLRRLSHELLSQGVRIRWACRSKLEIGHTKELFALMRQAGCYEVLFGLESISPRVQRLMDKYVPGLDEDETFRILEDLRDAGIGVHLNLLAGFPGDSVDDVDNTVRFALRALERMKHATFTLNQFTLFPGTPVLARASEFGIQPEHLEGDDMPAQYDFSVEGEQGAALCEVHAAIPSFQQTLIRALGWESYLDAPGGTAAVDLYFSSGHGAVFKAADTEVFANPLVAGK